MSDQQAQELTPEEREAFERAQSRVLTEWGGLARYCRGMWDAARDFYTRGPVEVPDVTSWADHANRITECERIIDGKSYVPTIEALVVVANLETMQDGVAYEPVEREGKYRWGSLLVYPNDPTRGGSIEP